MGFTRLKWELSSSSLKQLQDSEWHGIGRLGNQSILDSLKFMYPEVAKIIEACMNNYLMYEHLLQVSIVPLEKVRPKLWKGVSRTYKPLDWVQVARKHHDKGQTLE